MSPAPSRQPRMPREERRRQLLDAAMQVFVEHGYHGTSMDDIAVAAQVSKPVLYQHFPGKHELFMDLLETQVQVLSTALTEALSSTDDNRERVRATIRAYFQFMDRTDRAYRLLFDSGLNNDPAVATHLESLTYDEAITRNIRVMDQTAFSLCRDNNVSMRVFGMQGEGSVTRAILGEDMGTLITV